MVSIAGRRNHVHVIGFHSHAVARLAHGHGGGARQNFTQQAVVFRVETPHQDDCQTGVGWQIGQQMFEDFQPARTSSRHRNGGGAFDRRCGRCFRFVRRRRIDHTYLRR